MVATSTIKWAICLKRDAKGNGFNNNEKSVVFSMTKRRWIVLGDYFSDLETINGKYLPGTAKYLPVTS